MTAIEDPLRNLFTPTQKLMSLTYKHVANGNQVKLAQKLWEKAQTDEPLKLVRNAMAKVWQAINENDKPDEKGTNKS